MPPPLPPKDRIVGYLDAIVNAVLRKRNYDTKGEFPCTVIAQHGNLVDLKYDDLTRGVENGVPIKSPVPALIPPALPPPSVIPPVTSLMSGQRVTLAFENGDPSKPFIRGMNAGTIVAIVAGSVPAFVVTLTYLAPGATEPVPWLTFTATAGIVGTYPLTLTAVG